MNCPYCGRPMEFGHITGRSILRVVPDNGTEKKTEKHTADITTELYQSSNLPGWPLDIPYAGMAPWIGVSYCLPCRKVICELDIADLQKEGSV